MTSAPRSPSTIVQNGPGALLDRSTTLVPASGPGLLPGTASGVELGLGLRARGAVTARDAGIDRGLRHGLRDRGGHVAVEDARNHVLGRELVGRHHGSERLARRE